MENSNEKPSETNDATTNNNVQPHGCQNQTSTSVQTAKDDDPDRILTRLENLIFDQDFKSMSEMINDCRDEQQLQLIVTELTRDTDKFLAVVTKKFGSISVQSLIEKIRNSDGLRNKITSRMAEQIRTMMCVRVSFQVVSKCFQCLSDPQNTELFEAIIENYNYIVMDKAGNAALNNSLKHFPEPLRSDLFDRISSQAYALSKHRHWHQTVHKLLHIGDPRYTKKISESLKGHFVELSMEQKGKCIVNKCLLSGEEEMDIVLQELINSDKLVQMANDEFGNHVIDNALVKCKESQHFDTFWKKLNQDRHLLQGEYSQKAVAELHKLEQFDSTWNSE